MRKQQSIGTIIQIVRLKTELQDEEMLKTAHDREPQFKAIPVIAQNYCMNLAHRASKAECPSGIQRNRWKSSNNRNLQPPLPKPQSFEVPSVKVIEIMIQLME
ncbi:hypothetical protein [Maribellus sp. YY47]|uniref:hypothetical protein n=1 Tax=Maribellus sp. YY47 TaxID=2929486 RepID=UPI002000C249|nr:hypothetical protein [Maribellus sp. YY47]MCK3683217.1 hypothetical protein [Maribellus sp. YY47]